MSNAQRPTQDPVPTNPPDAENRRSGRFYAVVPTYETLTPTERVAVDAGGNWPVRESDYLARHETFLDFLIDRGVDAWSRENGGGR